MQTTQDQEKEIRVIKLLLDYTGIPDIRDIKYFIYREKEISVYLTLMIVLWVLIVLGLGFMFGERFKEIMSIGDWPVFIFFMVYFLVGAIVITVCFFKVRSELKPYRKLIKLLMEYELYKIFSVHENMLKPRK